MVYDGLERAFGWRVARFNYWSALLDRYAILHVSFPNIVFRNRSLTITLARYALAVAAIRCAKLLGRRVAWTVHNLADHESYHPRIEARFMDRYTRMLDLTIHLSEAGRDAALARYPRLAEKPAAIIPHPHYGETVDGPVTRAAALQELGLPADCQLVLAFGVVRRYKNLLKLIRAFNDLPGRDVHLLVAGLPLDSGLADAMHRVGDGRVTLLLRSIAETEIATLFGAATLVVAPYLDILNSGTAFMSLTFGRPILVPDRGAMSELQRHVGPDWVKLFEAPLTALTLGDALHWAGEARDEMPDLGPFAPERIVAAYDRAFADLI
jgi:glycosyltransferase involved in cell wall biosynthesis